VIDGIEVAPGGGHGSGRYHRGDDLCNAVASRPCHALLHEQPRLASV